MLSTGQRRLGAHRIVFLGGPNVGKTCLVKRCLGQTPSPEYLPTADDIYQTDICCACGNTVCPLQIFDTSGERLFPGMRDDSIVKAHGAVIAFNLNDESSFDEAVEIFHYVRRIRTGITPNCSQAPRSPLLKDLSSGRARSSSLGSPITARRKKSTIESAVDTNSDSKAMRVVFVGCKSDLFPEQTDSDAPVGVLCPRAATIASSMGCGYTEVSAVSGERVEEVLNSLLPEVCRKCLKLRKRDCNSPNRRPSSPDSSQFRLKSSGHLRVNSLRRQQKWHVLTASL